MVKTIWTCDDCGEQFNSRAARLYHRNHSCKAIAAREEVQDGKTIIDEEPVTVIDEPAPKEKRIETTDDYPIEKEKYDPLVDDIEPSFDGDTPEIPVVFIVAAAFILMLIAGLVIFRERVIAFFKSGKGGRPPTPAGV